MSKKKRPTHSLPLFRWANNDYNNNNNMRKKRIKKHVISCERRPILNEFKWENMTGICTCSSNERYFESHNNKRQILDLFFSNPHKSTFCEQETKDLQNLQIKVVHHESRIKSEYLVLSQKVTKKMRQSLVLSLDLNVFLAFQLRFSTEIHQNGRSTDPLMTFLHSYRSWLNVVDDWFLCTRKRCGLLLCYIKNY